MSTSPEGIYGPSSIPEWVGEREREGGDKGRLGRMEDMSMGGLGEGTKKIKKKKK